MGKQKIMRENLTVDKVLNIFIFKIWTVESLSTLKIPAPDKNKHVPGLIKLFNKVLIINLVIETSPMIR